MYKNKPIWYKISGWLLGACLLVLGLSFSVDAIAPTPTAISIDNYWAEMEATLVSVRNLKESPPEIVQGRLLFLAARWETITEVTLQNRSTIPVNHNFLVSQLRRNPPDLARVEALLESLLAARSAWDTPNYTEADIEILNQILANADFQWVQETQPESTLAIWWRNLRERFWEFIDWLLPDRLVVGLNSGWLNYIFTFIVTAILILILAFAFQQLFFDFVSEANIDLETHIEAENLTSESALNNAQSFSAEGDYRTAVRYLYLSALLLLDERGLLRYNRAQTNREYLRSVAHSPELARNLKEVIDVFDRVWYGYQPLDETTYNQYAAYVAALRRIA